MQEKILEYLEIWRGICVILEKVSNYMDSGSPGRNDRYIPSSDGSLLRPHVT